MAIGAGMSCVKYLLFSFNLLFAITGLIILIVGIKSEINAHPYVDLTDESFYTSAPVILIIVGLIVFIVAFFGCCGAVKENHCMIVTFSVFLLLIFIAELAVGIAGYVKHKDLETSIGRTLNESLTHYSTDPDIKKNYDIIQTDMHCCGIYGFEDWSHSKQPLPSSCCDTHAAVTDAPPSSPAPSSPAPPAPPTCTVTSPDLHKDGCLGVILTRLQAIALLLGGVGLGIALVQLLGVIFACCLARSIRSQYETV